MRFSHKTYFLSVFRQDMHYPSNNYWDNNSKKYKPILLYITVNTEKKEKECSYTNQRNS